jgi:hypothetical protein
MAQWILYPPVPNQLYIPDAMISDMQGPFGQAETANAANFIARLQAEVIGPTTKKSRFAFISPIDALVAELRRTCGKAPIDDIGVFLNALDCWVTEAFGWWAQVEQIGQQTLAVGASLIATAQKAQDEINARPPPNVFTQTEQSFIATTRRIGLSWQRTGNFLLGEAAEWKPLLREVGRISPVLRDIVIVFNDGIDQGTIDGGDPRIVKFRLAMEDVIDNWKVEIVNRVVDVAFATRRFALSVADLNTQLVNAQFLLSALLPGALRTIEDLGATLGQLAKSLELMSMPGNAIRGLFNLAGEGAAALIRKPGGAILDLILKAVLIVGGVAAVGVLGAVILKKAGVIGSGSTPIHGAGHRRRSRLR